MRTFDEVYQRIRPYIQAVDVVYDRDVGYLVWHWTTGGNVEPLFIEVAEKRKGHGKELYRRMVRKILATGLVPFHSVVAWRLTDNEVAGKFYDSLGFKQTDLGEDSAYKDRGATVMTIPWETLVDNLFPDGVK